MAIDRRGEYVRIDEEDDDRVAVFRGHITAAEFAQALSTLPRNKREGVSVSDITIEQTYARVVNAWVGYEIILSTAGRGAFPVTTGRYRGLRLCCVCRVTRFAPEDEDDGGAEDTCESCAGKIERGEI